MSNRNTFARSLRHIGLGAWFAVPGAWLILANRAPSPSCPGWRHRGQHHDAESACVSMWVTEKREVTERFISEQIEVIADSAVTTAEGSR